MSYLDAKPTDVLGRRHRYVRNPTDKAVRIGENDILLFEYAHRLGPQITPTFRELMRPYRTSRTHFYDRLKDLYQEDNGGGPYLQRIPTQTSPDYVTNTFVTHANTSAADKLLKTNGLWRKYTPSTLGDRRHIVFTSTIVASFYIMCRNSGGSMRFIYQDEVLERAGRGLGFPVTFEGRGEPVTKDLYPDAVFGIEYDVDGKKKYRVYIVEADRGTEPGRSYHFDRKSFERSMRQYKVFVGDKQYKTDLKTNAGVVVLNALTSELRLRKLLQLTNEVHPGGCNYMLYKAFPEFGEKWRPQGVQDVVHNWQCTGTRPPSITEV